MRNFHIGGQEIEWSNQIKYLGLVLDKKLTYKAHIQHVLEKTHKAVRILYSMLNRKSKLCVENKTLLYKVAIRPIFAYACPIFSSAAKTHINKLQICQNKTLRMIFGVPRYYRTNTIHNYASMEMVSQHFEVLHNNFLNRMEAASWS